MAKIYQQNQWNKVKEHFREHPYYKFCKTVFDELQKLCPTMVMTPEQLFVDASLTLDSILQTGDKSAEQCHSLWTEKYNQYREQDQMTGSPEDTKAEVAMLFYMLIMVWRQSTILIIVALFKESFMNAYTNYMVMRNAKL